MSRERIAKAISLIGIVLFLLVIYNMLDSKMKSQSESPEAHVQELLVALADVVADELGLSADQRRDFHHYIYLTQNASTEESEEFLESIEDDRRVVYAIVTFSQSLGAIVANVEVGVSILDEPVEEPSSFPYSPGKLRI